MVRRRVRRVKAQTVGIIAARGAAVAGWLVAVLAAAAVFPVGEVAVEAEEVLEAALISLIT